MSNCVEHEIKEFNTYTNNLTSYVKELQDRAGERKLKEFAEMRGFNLDTIREAGIFYIGDATEMLVPAYINKVEQFGVISPTNRKPIFHDRFVIPIKDTDGRVLNLVGYSKEANERYVYGTAKYYRRRETMYGLENLEMAYDMGYALFTEGITDTICLRNLGYKNTFANCGTHNSDFIMKQLNRCRYGVIKIPDRDDAGKRANDKWKCYRSVTLEIFVKYKDVDEMCRERTDNIEWLKEYLDSCIEWIKSKEHNGFSSDKELITIV